MMNVFEKKMKFPEKQNALRFWTWLGKLKLIILKINKNKKIFQK